MASTPKHADRQSYEQAAQTAAAAEKRPVAPSRAYVVKDGRLPVSELALDRPGASAPFGDDIPLPMPVAWVTYTHPSENAAPSPH
jgi:hypothetical protein